MTKNIRIENADTSDHPVRVSVQERREGEWQTIRTVQLDHPTALAIETIWRDGRRLVIEEREADPA